MTFIKRWVLQNWSLKLVSLLLAALLWAAVSNQTSSEVGLEVPLEYRNIPSQLEITGDITNSVQVRLRGSSNVIKGVTARDVSTTIDLAKMSTGERIVALSPQNVNAPFGAEVVRVNPSSVRFNLERTLVKSLPITPAFSGKPAAGFEIGEVTVHPSVVDVAGPESVVNPLSSIPTVPIRLDGKQSVEQMADLDLPDPQIRLLRPAPVSVKVETRHKQ